MILQIIWDLNISTFQGSKLTSQDHLSELGLYGLLDEVVD